MNASELKLEEEVEESRQVEGANVSSGRTGQEELTNGRVLEVYFQNFQLNYRRTDISFDVHFEAFFEDGSPIMKKNLSFGSDISINKVAG